MRKIILIYAAVFLFFSGCYKSWNGLNFKYTEIENRMKKLQPFGTEENEAELYAVKYGFSEFPESSIYYQGEKNKKAPFAWMFYILKGSGRIILVDTGFSDSSYVRQFGVTLKDPLELLESSGITPEDVTHVIITHSHFDHIGLVNKYKNAKIIIHKDALDFFFKVDKRAAQELSESENLEVFKDKITLFDSILVYPVGGHAPGSSVLFFTLNGRKFCLAGDEAYLLSNVTEQKPVGTYSDLQRNRNFLKELKDLEDTAILTFHDPLIAPGDPGIYRIE